MNSFEKTNRIINRMPTGRIPFQPTILEHCAKLIGHTPSETAVSEELLIEAQIKAFELYQQDGVTVGIDVYNIEAESLGCIVKFQNNDAVPGISGHPMREKIDLASIRFSLGKGRISMILNAAEKIRSRIGNLVQVSVGICGPFSIAAELVSYENLIFKCLDEPDEIHALLHALLIFQKQYSAEIIRRGLGIIVFESWATLPLVSPDRYREFVMPYERELINYLKESGLTATPLVIGGDTTLIVDDIIETGTTSLVADYNVDLCLYIKKAMPKQLLLRGNIDPKLVARGTVSEIIECVRRMLDQTQGYDHFVLGTGVIPYNTPKKNILAIKRYLEMIN